MPPPQQYPGLGAPIEAGLPFDVGPGTRAMGMSMLGAAAMPNLVQSLAEARRRTEEAYYSVPKPDVAAAPSEGLAQQAYQRQAPDLGPMSSGVAAPTPTDEDMMSALFRGPSRGTVRGMANDVASVPPMVTQGLAPYLPFDMK